MISTGFDLIDTIYPYVLTKFGYASTFWSGKGRKPISKTETKIDVRSLKFRTSKEPLMKGCACYACKNHSRGYINHLIHSREMLGDSLLFIHNMQQLLDLTSAARKHIETESFESFRTEWESLHEV